MKITRFQVHVGVGVLLAVGWVCTIVVISINFFGQPVFWVEQSQSMGTSSSRFGGSKVPFPPLILCGGFNASDLPGPAPVVGCSYHNDALPPPRPLSVSVASPGLSRPASELQCVAVNEAGRTESGVPVVSNSEADAIECKEIGLPAESELDTLVAVGYPLPATVWGFGVVASNGLVGVGITRFAQIGLDGQVIVSSYDVDISAMQSPNQDSLRVSFYFPFGGVVDLHALEAFSSTSAFNLVVASYVCFALAFLAFSLCIAPEITTTIASLWVGRDAVPLVDSSVAQQYGAL